MLTDIGLALAGGYCVVRLARSMAGPGALAVFAAAALAAAGLLVATGVLLLMMDAYSVTTLLAASALIALVAFLAAERSAAARPGETAPARGEGMQVVLLALIALPLATPGFQTIAMGADAGVYLNRALQLEQDGQRFPATGIDVQRLPPVLRERFVVDNRSPTASRPAVVEGLKVRPDGVRLEYHALPGWPVLLSVSGRLFGAENTQFVTVFVLMGLGAFMALSLRAMGVRPLLSLACAAAAMTLPIVVYFSRYPTVELLLAMACAGIVWALTSGRRFAGAAAGIGFALYAFVHLSSFLLLLVACLSTPFVAATLDAPGRRQLGFFLAVAGAAQLSALLAAHTLSPGYASDLIGQLGGYRNGLAFIGGLAILAMLIALALIPRRTSLHG